MQCPLCATDSKFFFSKRTGDYFHCENCQLAFLDPKKHLSDEGDKARYSQHNNDLNIQGYRDFLTKAFSPLLPHLKPGMIGLDYGSGPKPNGEELLRELGHICHSYDLHFTPKEHNDTVLNQTYDYVILCEVIEHFKNLKADLNRALSLLKKDGLLYIHTGFSPEKTKLKEQFPAWYYHHDQTHVIFFNEQTFLALHQFFDLELISISLNSVLFKKR